MGRDHVGWFGAISLCVGLAGLPACDRGEDAKAASDSKADAKDSTKTAAEADPAAGASSDDTATKKAASSKDRGEGSAKIGDTPWVAESAHAKIDDGKLRLTMSKMDMTDAGISRDAFSLVVDGYTGPGDYTTQGFDSNFSGVGFDVAAAKAAEADGKVDDAKVTAQAIDTIEKAEVILMSGTQVHIESADDDQVVGTFSWKPDGSMANKPAVTDGKFRAVIRKKK